MQWLLQPRGEWRTVIWRCPIPSLCERVRLRVDLFLPAVADALELLLTRTDLYNFITQSKLGVLGTIGGTGAPQSALVGIAVTEHLEIVFDTVKSSRKHANLIANPACSFAIGWAGEKTVQYEGEAEELTEAKVRAKYQRVYFQAWPECRDHMSWPGITYFVVRPRWIRFSDYDQNPPLIQEFTFPRDSASKMA
jgi:hypothetical protein